MELREILQKAILPAFDILPRGMDTPQARVMLLAIGLQESRFQYRRQIGGPARGFWQFEEGTRQTRGGVYGVYLHDSSRYWLDRLCASRGVQFLPDVIYRTLDQDDVLAAGVARLMLFTDRGRLPATDDVDGAWDLYLRTWRPGKPRLETWPDNHLYARGAA
ncbi:hypothetical protein [Cupriavidus sp. Marseille-Q8015]